MPKQPLKAKTVTERDRRLLHWIGINGVASFKQLHTVFWPAGTERTCRERLVQLEKAGWIEGHYVHTSRKRGELVYTLTRRCASEHFEAATRKRLMIGLPTLSELKQQLTAQDTRIVLDRMLAAQGKQVVNWLNERELRREAAYLKRKPGSRAWGGLADVADARVFIGSILTGPLRSVSSVPVEKTHSLQVDNGATSVTVNTTTTETAILSIASSAGNQKSWWEVEATERLDIEIDGQYFGQMLKNKIRGIARGKLPTLWVTTSDRAGRIESEIDQAGVSNIRVMVVDPLV